MKKKTKIIKGRWWKINNNIKVTKNAKYDKIKDWVMDPKGYFLIHVDKESNLIRVGYCKFSKIKANIHNMVAEVTGLTSLEIVNTLISNKYISSLQHAADMGIELYKAELSLKFGYKYVQDKDLIIKKN